MLHLPVVESFGPTLQGEGPYAGRLAHFIRLGGCNLSCSWCDTPYSWDASRFDLRREIETRSVSSLLDEVASSSGLVVLTGGEPLLHQRSQAFVELLRGLSGLGRSVHIETNGTICPSDDVVLMTDVIVVSPKLPNAHLQTTSARTTLRPEWELISRRTEVHFKFVCESAEDVRSSKHLAALAGISPSSTWVMPQAQDKQPLLDSWPEIASAAALVGVNATLRLHLLAWGSERGR